jgi:hypothetical protein
VACDAVAPALGVTIGARTFYHQPEDLIVALPDGSCVTAVLGSAGETGSGGSRDDDDAAAASSSITLNFLGDAFLYDVVAIFDMARDEMRFAARAAAADGSASEKCD